MTPMFRAEEPAPPHVHLDFVISLPPAPGRSIADAAIMLRTDVEATLFALLQSWPVPSRSAETLLVRREDDRVFFLNELRHEPDSALRLRIPDSERRALAVQAVFGSAPPGTLIEGIDYRGVPALGVAYPVGGTDWWLVAKMDVDERYAEARTDGVLIAAGSTDAIFAKDRAGCYLLYNRAASEYVGRPAGEMIGRDDHAVFPAEVAVRLQSEERRVMDEDRTLEVEQAMETVRGRRVFLVRTAARCRGKGDRPVRHRARHRRAGAG